LKSMISYYLLAILALHLSCPNILLMQYLYGLLLLPASYFPPLKNFISLFRTMTVIQIVVLDRFNYMICHHSRLMTLIINLFSLIRMARRLVHQISATSPSVAENATHYVQAQ